MAIFRTIDKRPREGTTAPTTPVVVRRAPSSPTTITYDPVIPDGSIDYDQIQDVSANRLLGRNPSSSGPMEEIFIGNYLGLTGTTLSFTGPLLAIDGGTGLTSFAVGDILYADTTTTLAKLPIGSAGEVLTVTAGLPAWETAASGSGFTTADNGLTASSATNVQLGGTLLQSTTIATGTLYNLTLSGNYGIGVQDSVLKVTQIGSGGRGVYSAADTGVGVYGTTLSGSGVYGTATNGNAVVASATSGIGVAATSSSSIAVSGVSTSGLGASFGSTSGIGMQASSESTYAGKFQTATASSNGDVVPLLVRGLTSSFPATNGLGVRMEFDSNTTNFPTIRTLGKLGYEWTTAADGTRTSAFDLSTVNNTTESRKLLIAGNGEVTFDTYGDGTFAATPTYFAGWDTNGKFVEILAASVGGFVTADNGLTASSATNVQLGGTLLGNTTITTTSAYSLIVTGSPTSTGSLRGINTSATFGSGVKGTGTSGTNTSGVHGEGNLAGVYGESSAGYGVYAVSGTGSAYYGQSSSGSPIYTGTVQDAGTTTVIPTIQLVRASSGTAANGLGQSIVFINEVVAGNGDSSNALVSR